MPSWIRTLAAATVVAALTLAVVLIPRPSQRPSTPTPPADIVKLEIHRPRENLTLIFEKSASGWRLTSPVNDLADSEPVDRLVQELKNLSLEAVLSHRTESHGLFDVDNTSGSVVRVWGSNNTPPLAWVVGKNTPDSTHVYVRAPGSPDVFFARGLNAESIGRDINEWRNGKVIPVFDNADLQSVQIKRDGRILQLERNSSSWTLNGATVDTAQAEQWINGLKNLSSKDFVDSPASLNLEPWGLKSPQARVSFIFKNGTDLILQVGRPTKTDPTNLVVQREGTPTLYRIPRQTIDPRLSFPPKSANP